MNYMTAGMKTDEMFGGGHGEDMWRTMLNQEYGKEIAKRGGLTSALITGKTKFVALEQFGSVDWSSIAKATDEEVGKAAAEIVREHRPALTVIHFPGGDAAGHSKGWGGPEQIAAIEGIDRAIGGVLEALEQTGMRGSTVVILSADHGGAGKSHGPNDPRSRHIPWIAAGPGVLLTAGVVYLVPIVIAISALVFLLDQLPGIEPSFAGLLSAVVISEIGAMLAFAYYRSRRPYEG